MSTLEQEILDIVRRMDEPQQQQGLGYLQSIEPLRFDADRWFQQVATFQDKLQAKYGSDHHFGTQSLLDELREEASWPRS